MKKAVWKQEVIDEYRYRITESIANEKDDKILSSYYNDLVILESIEDYQKDGKCCLDKTVSQTFNTNNDCAYFKKRE